MSLVTSSLARQVLAVKQARDEEEQKWRSRNAELKSKLDSHVKREKELEVYK